jgi:hypothetical protein
MARRVWRAAACSRWRSSSDAFVQLQRDARVQARHKMLER